ncbi:hypothetical protein LTR04_003278, partial [Oleoguttula sp. CCFEE 6159]
EANTVVANPVASRSRAMEKMETATPKQTAKNTPARIIKPPANITPTIKTIKNGVPPSTGSAPSSAPSGEENRKTQLNGVSKRMSTVGTTPRKNATPPKLASPSERRSATKPQSTVVKRPSLGTRQSTTSPTKSRPSLGPPPKPVVTKKAPTSPSAKTTMASATKPTSSVAPKDPVQKPAALVIPLISPTRNKPPVLESFSTLDAPTSPVQKTASATSPASPVRSRAPVFEPSSSFDAPKSPVQKPNLTLPPLSPIRKEQPILELSPVRSPIKQPPFETFFKPGTPASKQKAVSEAEAELSKVPPPWALAHLRQNSRPFNTAMSDDGLTMQRIRSVEVVEELLREARTREALEEQVKDLQAELANHQKQKAADNTKSAKAETQKQAAAAKAGIDKLQTEHASTLEKIRGDTQKEAAAVKAATEKLQTDYDKMVTKLKDEHLKEATQLRAKLDSLKLKKVQQSNLEEHQRKEEAAKLDAERAAKQIEQIREQLEAVKRQSADDLQRKDQAATQAFKSMQELRSEMETIKSQSSDEHKRKDQKIEATKRSLDEMKIEMTKLKEQLDREVRQKSELVQRSDHLAAEAQGLKEKLEVLEVTREDEIRKHDEERNQTAVIIEGFQLEIRKMQHNEGDASIQIGELQEEVRQLQLMRSESDRDRKAVEERLRLHIQELQKVAETVQQEKTQMAHDKDVEIDSLSQ